MVINRGDFEQFGLVRISDFGFDRRGERAGRKGWKLELLIKLEERTWEILEWYIIGYSLTLLK